MWLSELRTPCCHCCGSGYCYDMDLIPGPGTSTCCRCGQKKKKKCIQSTSPLSMMSPTRSSFYNNLCLRILDASTLNQVVFAFLFLLFLFSIWVLESKFYSLCYLKTANLTNCVLGFRGLELFLYLSVSRVCLPPQSLQDQYPCVNVLIFSQLLAVL